MDPDFSPALGLSDRALNPQPEAVDHDRVLLELAAVASGIYTVDPVGDDDLWCAEHTDEAGDAAWPPSGMRHCGGVWNPLVDCGDCARMESEIRLDVYWYYDHVSVHSSDGKHSAAEDFDNHDGDSHSARLRASVRAAAAIGSELRKTASGSHRSAVSDEQDRIGAQGKGET